MTYLETLRLPLSTDLSGFVRLLYARGVPHRVSEEGDVQVLWVAADLVEQVRALYQRHPQGDGLIALESAPADQPVNRAPSLLAQVNAFKVTAGVIVLCLLVAAVTGLGDNLASVGWFTFLKVQVQGEYLYFTSLAQGLAAGQWWRLVSPMLLHFGVLHLAMNSLWYWELGRRIEARQGPWVLLGLTLLFSLVSNLAQHFTSGPGVFGGLSGVLYGLLGHLWLYQRLAPSRLFELPRGVLVMMLVWLVVCLTGVVGQLGMGQIANAAHVGGLLIGCLTGLLGGAWARRKLGVA
ncbi:rhomboid family intramembrane serine protease [Pseudomonas sp. RP23018S]|uniref:rhomboid family intramembrane serine protease n=1 Tax=Pseudomonas sp. RP23018S TaxID=3096037 RepID=UPI002ACA3653|nr:rhomboid family intramembrane serine protease [Pseudomonas sp. RP23018S]MDZ5602236.1 rhomboid family intramembrane serine protease [Pseudomonas sp. RP23018S]